MLFSYCDRMELNAEQEYDFLRIVPAMDIKYREWLISKKPDSPKKPKGKT